MTRAERSCASGRAQRPTPLLHPLARRRAVAFALDGSSEPFTVLWTLAWIDPMSSRLRAGAAAAWMGWVGLQLRSQAATGQTWGKRHQGIVVVDARTGEPLGLRRTGLRWGTHLIDTLTLVGWAMGAWNGRTMADRLSGAEVRRVDRLVAGEEPG